VLKYGDELLLFLIETNPNAPAEFRINGVLRNMPTFYQAIGVKPGDGPGDGPGYGMYLPEDEQVDIW